MGMINIISRRKKLIGDIIIAGMLIIILSFNLLAYFENVLQDAAYQKPGLSAPYITVIGIDEHTLLEFEDEYGRFTDWSRQKVAEAINILNRDEDAKPAVIAIDILYTGASGNAEADAALAEAAADGGNVVFASLAHFGRLLTDGGDSYKYAVTGHETPYPELARNSVYGVVNALMDDRDSLVREFYLRVPYDGETLYSFPVEIYRKYMEYMGDENEITDNFIERNEAAYIKYSGNPFDYVDMSFADIFEDDFEPDYYEGEIILIGAYAPKLGDAYYTSVNRRNQMYGVEIHANVVKLLIDGDFSVYVPGAVNFGAVIIFFILLPFVIIRLIKDIRLLLLVFVITGAGYYFTALYVFGRGYILTLLYPLFSLVIIYIYQVVYGYVLEAVEKRKLKTAFKKYVDPKLADKLIESGEANSNEVGVKKNIAVLFVDVRGFTPMSEALKEQPELVVKILNEYLELTAGAVFNNDGSVDKFVGDATMALFNGFFHTEDYIFKAVKAAYDMVRGAAEVNASIKEKYGVDVGFGIGINCGEAIVGNLGPSFRKDYTAIGDTVNTAARLESIAKPSEILISKEVYETLKGRIETVSIGEKALKGKSTGAEVFSVKKINI